MVKIKYLVTGGNGFVGVNLRHELERYGHEVKVIDVRGNQCVDITDEKNHPFIESLVQWSDVVFHLAAIPAHRLSMDEPYRIVKNNYLSALVMAEICTRNRKKIVYASSFSVYGKQPTPWKEDARRAGTTPYSHSKIAAEEMLEMYHKNFGLDCIIARFSNVFGPFEHLHQPQQVLPTWFDIAKKGGTIVVHGRETTRDFTFVWDICRALMVISRKTGFEIYNLCAGEETRLVDVAHWITDNVEVIDLPKHETQKWVGDNSKLRELGWGPTKPVYHWVKEELIRRNIRCLTYN